MHILIISYDFCLSSGGIQNTSYLLAEYLTAYSDISCLSLSDGHDLQIPKVDFYKSDYSWKEFSCYNDNVCNEIMRIHQYKKIDYILCVIYQLAYNPYLINKRYSIPFGVMCHGNEVLPIKLKTSLFHHRILKRLNNLYSKHIILQHSSNIFTNSNFTKHLVQKYVFLKKITVINGPIDFYPSFECHNYKAPIIFSIGRLVERKGFQYVLESLPKVLQIHHNLQYIIAGDGPYKTELEKITKKLGIESHVKFVGKITNEQKIEYYNECGIFAMPSILIKDKQQVEGFGLVYIEANAFGKPAIGSKTGGVPEVILDGITGFLVNEKDSNEISNILLKFYDDEFEYNPQKCFERALKCHIKTISEYYYNNIYSAVKK